MVRVAINGYGRIGRIAHRIIAQSFGEYGEVVAINAGSSTDIKGWMYLLKYDSVYGTFSQEVKFEARSTKSLPADATHQALQAGETNSNDPIGNLIINGKTVHVYSQKDPSVLPWKMLGIDVVIESTGHFRKKEDLEKHIQAGAKKVILSAPASNAASPGKDIPTIVLSINEDMYKGETVVSNASCTTNCITPVAKIIHENFGIEKAMMTTIHGYTTDQRLQDGGHEDYRRARAAGLNIIPTSTGATTSAAQAFPALENIFDGLSIRVPVPVGSLADFTFLLKKSVTKEEVNSAFIESAKKELYAGILTVTEDPLVSSDIIGNPHSAVVDLSLTQVVGGTMVKVIAWYDNEFGYANRLVEEALMIGRV